jgi:hypothetical protein
MEPQEFWIHSDVFGIFGHRWHWIYQNHTIKT